MIAIIHPPPFSSPFLSSCRPLRVSSPPPPPLGVNFNHVRPSITRLMDEVPDVAQGREMVRLIPGGDAALYPSRRPGGRKGQLSPFGRHLPPPSSCSSAASSFTSSVYSLTVPLTPICVGYSFSPSAFFYIVFYCFLSCLVMVYNTLYFFCFCFIVF